ncbi:MAG: sigma-54 interaction domain-containing protein [Desulfatiglandales bacterium]
MEQLPRTNDPPKEIQTKPEIPPDVKEQWQRLLDAFVGVTGLSGAMITRADNGSNEVFVSSPASRNFGQTTGNRDLNLSDLCERVMRDRTPLLVTGPPGKAGEDHPPGALYLGYPLLWPDDELFGAVCVYNGLSPPQAEQIEKATATLCATFGQELRMIHEARESLIRSERTLSESQRIAHVGSWDWDIRGGTHCWSEEFHRILGLWPEETKPALEIFLASVHPDDRQAVEQAAQQSMCDPARPYAIQYRVVRPDGGERHVQARGEFFFDRDRSPVRMIGTLHDISGHKQSEEELKTALDEIRKLKEKLEVENIYLRKDTEFENLFKGLLGISNAIKYVTHRIEKVATTGATVLLTGETGTGKGVFARTLHLLSKRKDRPFVHVNCAGLPANLIESELFGREKGAFTGSTARQIGRFELADGGTIFLDEIGELPLELQSKLLKVLEDGEFERLGSPHTVKADVRVIASTNRNLFEESRHGRFRMDLFYRLNVFPVTVPPLRQRREDIPLFVEFFTRRLSKRYGKDIQQIPRKTMQALEGYDWPGNVRELANVIERAVIVSDGPVLHLAEKIDALPDVLIPQDTPDPAMPPPSKDIEEVERDHIRKTLLQTGWKISGPNGAAERLGLNPNTLRSRMKRLGIRRPGTP